MIARRMAAESNTKVRINYAHPAGTQRFINFMMRPEISAQITRFIGFASGNAAALPLLDPAVRDNPIVHPPPAIRSRFDPGHLYSTDEVRAFTRAWQRFSTGE